MEIYKGAPKKFLPNFERNEPVLVDHTAIIAAKHCPRKYFYQIVLGMQPKSTPAYFTFGGAYHKFREILEVEYLKHPENDTDNLIAIGTVASNAASSYYIKHSSGSDYSGTKWDYLTLDRLLQCCIQVAMPYWINEKRAGAVEVICSEQSLNCQLSDGSFRSGRADQIVRWHSDVWGRDFKTSSKNDNFYERGVNPNDQFIGYTLIEGRVTGLPIKGQLIEVLFNPKGKTPYIRVYPVSHNKYQLETFEKECGDWNKMTKAWRDVDSYPMSHFNCTFCAYHQVCDKNSERAIEYMLKSEYEHKPWDSATVHDD
jgi:hypothetical protein